MKKMNASSLKLPAGCGDGRAKSGGGAFIAWYWGPLRVVVGYHINSDAFIARFDSVIDDDEQYNCCFEQDLHEGGSMDARDFGWLCLPFAMKAFREGKVAKGHQSATPIRVRFEDL